MNPFTNRAPDLSGAIDAQIQPVGVGQSLPVDLHGRDVATYRAALCRRAKVAGMKFRTRVAVDGALWILRTK